MRNRPVLVTRYGGPRRQSLALARGFARGRPGRDLRLPVENAWRTLWLIAARGVILFASQRNWAMGSSGSSKEDWYRLSCSS